jgi:membrane complex biogenesis BtpA family protein
MGMTAEALHEMFGTPRPVIGMVHFPPLPCTALYDREGGVAKLRDVVKRDVEALVDAGFDAVMFCNEGDRPYALKAPLEAVSAMTAVIAQVAPQEIPFGVDYLWDPLGALAVAHATGAAFVREVFTGTYESDMGLWSPDPSFILRYRSELGAENVRLFMNVTPEFAASLGSRPVGVRAKSAVVKGLADVILIAGALAGSEPTLEDLDEAKAALGDAAPVFVNTGVTVNTVAEFLTRFDGVIVGTALKYESCTWNPVDPEQARLFMETARAGRSDVAA